VSATSLANQIRGTLEALPELRSLAERAREPSAPPWEKDACLREVVRAYRADRSWSPLLLELLAPAMAAWLAGIEPAPPVIDEDDVRQQLLLEVLEAAATMPLQNPQFLERAIIDRASREVERWLFCEEELIDITEPLPTDDDDDGDQEDEQ